MDERSIMAGQAQRPRRQPGAAAPGAPRRGYISLRGSAFVPEGEALARAAADCGFCLADPGAPAAAEFCRMVVEWYYSGEYRRTDE